MPYLRSLQSYLPAEVFTEPPADWERRLREISPVTERMSHLRFRYRAPSPDWLCDAPVWELYACTPRHLVTPDRAVQFEKHWSELPPGEQPGRKAFVTSYQHYMWHVHGVEARRFWVLQGQAGGTPAVYTRLEQRYLDGIGAISDPFPLGFFPRCPFDERAVTAIAARDRFYKAAQSFDALLRMDRPAALKAEDEAAERKFRETWLDWWFAQIQPQKEFMASRIGKSQIEASLPPAPEGLADTLATWQDTFKEHGSIPGAGVAKSRNVQVAVA